LRPQKSCTVPSGPGQASSAQAGGHGRQATSACIQYIDRGRGRTSQPAAACIGPIAAPASRYDDGMSTQEPPRSARPHWQRLLWGTAGAVALLTGIVGAFLPVLPTTPLVLLAAFCFSRSSSRAEAWMLAHPRFGPMVRNWRQHRAVPLRAKQVAWVMMAISSVWAWWAMPSGLRWLPGLTCLAVGIWLYRLPSRVPAGEPPTA